MGYKLIGILKEKFRIKYSELFSYDRRTISLLCVEWNVILIESLTPRAT